MTPKEIIGTWVHANAVPMGGGVMRMMSYWDFRPDGTATLAARSVLEHGGHTATQTETNHAGRWSIVSDNLVVDLSDHSDSPFQLSLTKAGELRSRKRGVWRRPKL